MISLMRARLDRHVRKDLFKALSVLVGGTALAHIVTAAVLPASTRLYSPSDFSVAAAFMGVVNIIAVASCLRYEMAIPLVDDDDDAFDLLVLSCGLAVCTGCALAVVFVIWPDVFHLVGQGALSSFGGLIAALTTLTGIYLALQMWFVRQKSYVAIANSRVGQSLLGAGFQVGLGLGGVAPAGLLIGQGANAGGGAMLLAAKLLVGRQLPSPRFRRMASLAVSHIRFPKFSVLEALANSASIYAPVLLITALVPGPTAGYLALATFVLQAPMALVGNSIQQIFVASAPEENRQGQLDVYVVDMLRTLAKLSAAPLVFLAVAGPQLFSFFFGEAWRPSGFLVAWMMPWFFVQFLASPISSALHIKGRQKAAMSLQLAGLVIRLTAVWVAAVTSPAWVAEAYALSGFVFYALYLAVIFWSMNLGVTSMLGVLRVSLISGAVGLAGGGVVLAAVPVIHRLFSIGTT